MAIEHLHQIPLHHTSDGSDEVSGISKALDLKSADLFQKLAISEIKLGSLICLLNVSSKNSTITPQAGGDEA